MCASWKSGYDPAALVAKIEAARRVENGQTVYDVLPFEHYSPVLLSALELDARIPETERLLILEDAIDSAALTPPLSPQRIKAEASRREAAFRRRTSQPYILATTLSIQFPPPQKTRRLAGSTLTFSRSIPRRFDRADAMSRAADYDVPEEPSDYCAVRVRVNARSPAEASARAIDALDLLRGIWSLYLGYGTYRLAILGRPSPLGDVSLGPLHTLHEAAGGPADEIFTFEPSFRRRHTIDLAQKREPLLKFESWVRRRLRTSSYREQLESWLRRYARAIDTIEWSNVLIRLWSLLESMTFTAGASYDVTIRRASFIFRDRALSRQVLTHLREHRNAIVHSDNTTGLGERLATQLKRFCEQLLLFHIRRSSRFPGMQAAIDYLEQPTEATTLRARIKLLREVLSFITPTEHQRRDA